jgi:hypothetical protein
LDVWNGEIWEVSEFVSAGVVRGAGGGAWMRFPAGYATKWRLVAEFTKPAWRLSDVRFYSDANCSDMMPLPGNYGDEL